MRDVLLNNVKDHLSVEQFLKAYDESYSTIISLLPMEQTRNWIDILSKKDIIAQFKSRGKYLEYWIA